MCDSFDVLNDINYVIALINRGIELGTRDFIKNIVFSIFYTPDTNNIIILFEHLISKNLTREITNFVCKNHELIERRDNDEFFDLIGKAFDS